MTSAIPHLQGILFNRPCGLLQNRGRVLRNLPPFFVFFYIEYLFNRFIAWSGEGILTAYLFDPETA
jgi:hypothetical protein